MRCPTLKDLPPAPPGKTGWPWDSESPQLPAAAPDGQDWPRIAIVTPSYNQGGFIEETLRSVLLQGYPNLEYRVLDGGSQDETIEILRRYEPWLTSWSSGPDGGQSDAINKGFSLSAFRMGTWLNSDDFLFPGALQAVSEHVAGNPSCEFAAGDGVFVDESGRQELFTQPSAAHSLAELLQYGAGKYLPQPSVFFSKALFERAGRLAAQRHYAMDFDLWLRMRQATSLDYIPRSLSALRQHADAKTVRDNEKAMLEVEQVILTYRHRVSFAALTSALRAIRGVRARSACATALRAYFDGDRAAAWKGMLRAVATYPPSVVGVPMGQVALRLCLPPRIRSLLFVRP